MEPDRFDYSPIIDRPVIKWPDNARVAFWLSPNVEYLEYDPAPIQARPSRAHQFDFGLRFRVGVVVRSPAAREPCYLPASL